MTLATTQVEFLVNSLMPEIERNYHKYLKDMESSEAYLNKKEEIKNSEAFKECEAIIKRAFDLNEERIKLYKLYNKTMDSNNCMIGANYAFVLFDYNFCKDEGNTKSLNTIIENYLNSLTKKELNIIQNYFRPNDVKKDLKATLCLTKEAPFEDIKTEMLNKFNPEELFKMFDNINNLANED